MIIMILSSIEGNRSLGGVDTACQNHLTGIMEYDNESGNEYIIIAFNPANDLQKEGVELRLKDNITLIWFNRSQGSIFSKIATNFLRNQLLVRSAVKRYRPHIVHSHMPDLHIQKYATEQKILTLHQYNKIGRSHVGYLNNIAHEKVIEPKSIRESDLITCVSKEVIDFVKIDHNKNPIYVPNSLNQKYFRRRVLASDIREINIFLSGAITPGKRVMDALDVVEIVRHKYPSIHLRIAGRFGRNEAYNNSITERVRSQSLSKHVTLLGSIGIDQIIKEISKSHVALFMSECETFGLSPLECLAAGLPLVTTEVGVFQWHKEEFEARGVDIIKPGDVSSAARAIEKRISKNDFNNSINLSDFMNEKFSLKSNATQYLKAYDSVEAVK